MAKYQRAIRSWPKYHRVMAVVAIILGIIGAGTGVTALVYSSRAAKASEKSAAASEVSANASLWANASALAANVEVALGGEVRTRWKFIFLTNALRPMGNLPVVGQQDESFSSPAFDELTVACATRLLIKNKGERRARVTINATSLAFDDPFFSQLAETHDPTVETRTSLTATTFELRPDEERNLIVYCGRTVKEWLDAGGPTEPEEFEVTVDIFSGPDAATLHWMLAMKASLFDSVYGQASTVRIAPALPPEVSLVELPRTINSTGVVRQV